MFVRPRDRCRRAEAGARPAEPKHRGATVSRVLTVFDWWNNDSVTLATAATGILVIACAACPMVWWVWPHPWRAPLVNAALAGVAGLIATGLVSLAGVLGFSWQRLQEGKPPPKTVRRILSYVHDVISYLREPSRTPLWLSKRSREGPLPRQRILARYAGLVDHITSGGGDGRQYEELIIFSHSQGAVLSTALLAETRIRAGREADAVKLPPRLRVALLTCGTPLLHLYAARFPHQFRWVTDLHTMVAAGLSLDEIMHAEHGFVRGITDAWVNYGSLQDPVGITFFYPPFQRPGPDGRNAPAGTIGGSSGQSPSLVGGTAARDVRPFPGYVFPSPGSRIRDHCIGDGDHNSYWTAGPVFGDLGEMLRR